MESSTGAAEVIEEKAKTATARIFTIEEGIFFWFEVLVDTTGEESIGVAPLEHVVSLSDFAERARGLGTTSVSFPSLALEERDDAEVLISLCR